VTDAPIHPAKFSPEILQVLDGWIRMESFFTGKRQRRMRVLDPMAGTGRVHRLPGLTFGVEIEREWAAMHPRTTHGNALHLPWKANSFDCIVVSPPFGNRLSDSHNAQDGSVRHSYTHDLGHKLHEDNTGHMPWGPEYRKTMRAIWTETARVLRPEGLWLLDVSDFVKGGEIVPVSRWHKECLNDLGLTCFAQRDIPIKRMRFGQNHAARVEATHVLAFRAGPC
jgi:hypothetical protein